MINTIKAFLIRHIQSPGFKRRVKNIYLPALKQVLAKPYNYLITKYQLPDFVKEYEESKAIELPVEQEQADAADQYAAEGKIMTEEDAIELFKQRFNLNHEDQQFGTCVAHTMKNIHRFAVKTCFDGQSDFSEHDVYIDRGTRPNGIDSGMYPSRALDRMIEKGIAIRGVVPTATEKSDLQTTRADYPDELLAGFRIKLIKERRYINAEKDFEPVWAYIVDTFNKKGVRPFQFSIYSMTGWWGNDVPKASGRTLGGHSVMGLTIPFMFGNKRAFLAIDSSYRRGTSWRIAPGVRIVTEDCWNGLGRAIRPLTYIDEVEAKLGGTNIVIPAPPAEQLLVGAAYGQNNEHVTKIQKALMSAGFDIPAISSGQAQTGYYGEQTAQAVYAFHSHFAAAFTMIDPYWTIERLQQLQGRSFGNLSIQVMNSILKSL